MWSKADAGVDLAAAFAVQPDVNINRGFTGDAVDVGVTVAFGQLGGNRLPVKTITLIAQAGDAHVLRQLDVGLAVANHVAVGAVHHVVLQERIYQRGFRFAAVAVVAGKCGQINTRSKRTPCEVKICIIRLCGGSKSACVLLVPRPS